MVINFHIEIALEIHVLKSPEYKNGASKNLLLRIQKWGFEKFVIAYICMYICVVYVRVCKLSDYYTSKSKKYKITKNSIGNKVALEIKHLESNVANLQIIFPGIRTNQSSLSVAWNAVNGYRNTYLKYDFKYFLLI